MATAAEADRTQRGPTSGCSKGPARTLKVRYPWSSRPARGSSYTGWVGGFDIKGPLPACVALDVQVSCEQVLRRLAIPFGAATGESACRDEGDDLRVADELVILRS